MAWSSLIDLGLIFVHNLMAAGLDPFLQLLVCHKVVGIESIPIYNLVELSFPAFVRGFQRRTKTYNVDD